MKRKISYDLACIIENGLQAKGKPHEVGWRVELGLGWSIVRKSHSYKLYRNKASVGKIQDVYTEVFESDSRYLFVELVDRTLIEIPLRK